MRSLTTIVILTLIALIMQAQSSNHDVKQIDSLLRTIYKDDMPGAAVAILENGKVLFKKSYGIARVGTNEKIAMKTNFNIGSLTKQFTALAILQLAEKNKLALSDNLLKFFPNINQTIGNIITIRELLTHSSGIIDHYEHTDTRNMK